MNSYRRIEILVFLFDIWIIKVIFMYESCQSQKFLNTIGYARRFISK